MAKKAVFLSCLTLEELLSQKPDYIAEAASVQMKEYNSIVRANIVGKSVEKHMRKTYYSGSLAAYTRYTK